RLPPRLRGLRGLQGLRGPGSPGREARRGRDSGVASGSDLMSDDRWLVAGLGNPGPQYAGNRHNAGFMVADLLAVRLGAGFRRDRSRVQAASGRLAGLPVIIAKPTSFMNLAGSPIAAVAGFYKIPPDRIAVVHDELD